MPRAGSGAGRGLRSGVFQVTRVDLDLAGEIAYVTDDNDADAAFTPAQKQLAGDGPGQSARNAAGTRVYVPLFGSDLVQELEVTPDAVGLRATGRTFATRELPAAVAVDEGASSWSPVSAATCSGSSISAAETDCPR